MRPYLEEIKLKKDTLPMKTLVPTYSNCTVCVAFTCKVIEIVLSIEVGLHRSALSTSRAVIFLPELSQRRALNQCTSSGRDSSSSEIELRHW